MSYIVLETVLSGIFVASAFPIGALIAIVFNYSTARRALFAAFGAGIFFSAVMLLVQETLRLGGFLDLLVGFSLGAITFGIAQHFFKHDNSEKGQKRKKHSEGKLAVVGTILDSVPESLFIGIIIALQEPGLFVAEAVIFLGNLATTLEGAKIMKKQGIKNWLIMRDWLFDFVIVAIAAPVGYFLAKNVIQDVLAGVLGFAAGTLVVFISGELISRAYRESTGHAEDFALSVGFIVGVLLLFVIG